MKLAIVFLACFVTYALAGENWALLFCGAFDSDNYAAEAYIHHAHYVLLKAGLPSERVVVVLSIGGLCDQTATHCCRHVRRFSQHRSPVPGMISNNYNHTDVYKGTPMDYSHDEVSREPVLA